MVASFALPASAATATHTTAKPKTPAVSVVLPTAAPSAAQAPLVSPSFGDIGFSGVAKPKPVSAVARLRATDRSSRSATRLSVTGPAPGPAPAQAASSNDVIRLAVSLSGLPYLYGGTTPAGFDCSGFTQYIFAKLGVSLPRTAEQQRQATTPVSIPQVGDLVFFGNPGLPQRHLRRQRHDVRRSENGSEDRFARHLDPRRDLRSGHSLIRPLAPPRATRRVRTWVKSPTSLVPAVGTTNSLTMVGLVA